MKSIHHRIILKLAINQGHAKRQQGKYQNSQEVGHSRE